MDQPRPSRIHKVIVQATLFLLFGAIVNVAVAWGFSMRSMPRGPGQPLLVDQDTIEWWRTHAPDEFPDAPAGMYKMHAFGGRMLLLYETEHVERSTSYVASRIARGWPVVSMELTVWVNRKTRTTERQHAIRLSGRPFGVGIGRSVPLHPVWPAFAINTLFYAAILWMLFTSVTALRRWRRIKRGLCPACAYPVGTSEVCTECGKPVTLRSLEPQPR